LTDRPAAANLPIAVDDGRLRRKSSAWNSYPRLSPQTSAILFFGPRATFVPLGSGRRCVGSVVQRVSPPFASDSQGQLSIPIDVTAWPFADGMHPIVPGSAYGFQLWYRDPAGSATSNLSDALHVVFAQ